jgi:hypothetical protein
VLNDSVYLHDGAIGNVLGDKLPGLALPKFLVAREVVTKILRIEPKCKVGMLAPAVDAKIKCKIKFANYTIISDAVLWSGHGQMVIWNL